MIQAAEFFIALLLVGPHQAWLKIVRIQNALAYSVGARMPRKKNDDTIGFRILCSDRALLPNGIAAPQPDKPEAAHHQILEKQCSKTG
jgi:hypothetical protein